MVGRVQTLQGSSEIWAEVFSTAQMDFFLKNSWTAKSQRRSLWVHREHAILWVICGGCISQCNEDDRQGMSTKNHVKAARITPLLFISQYLSDMGWTGFNVIHFHREKQFFSQKDFCLPVTHKYSLRPDTGFLKKQMIDLSWAWKRPTFLHFHSTVLCPHRYQWLGLICRSGFSLCL